MENGGTFYGHLEYYTPIWYIYGHYGRFVVPNLVYFSRSGVFYQKIWQPWTDKIVLHRNLKIINLQPLLHT
jgi:hypothetical protein